MAISFPRSHNPRNRRTAKRRRITARSDSGHSKPARSSAPLHRTASRQPIEERTGYVARMMRRRSSSSSRNTTVRSPYPSPPLPQPSPIRATRSRLILVWGVLLLAMVALALNLLRIQVLQASTLREQAKAQQMVFLGPIVPRRSIVDRSGTVLAIDTPVYTLYAHPLLFKNSKETIAEDLAGILDQPAEQLVSQLSQGESGIRIVDNLSEDIAKQITELQQDGLELIQAQQRLYPQQDLFANIVGYVNLDRQGQSGVEYTLENQLQQPLGAMQLSRSGDGTIIPVGLPSDFMQHQRDDLRLELTLDSRLQRATRFALKQQMEKYSAKRGAVVVMDVHDGSILSLVSEPSYDPNKYYQADMERLRNWVLTDLYEPGSTFKPINLAIALQAGTIQPEDSFFDEGAIEVGGWPIQNNDFEDTGARGDLSVPEILQYSSNVGMVRIMQTLQPGLYYGWLDRLKLNEPTGIDLPSEATGYLKSYEQFTGAIIEPATAAFGQGFSLTPIKLIQLHSMLANGGKMVVPHVVRGLTAPGGTLDWQPAIDPPRQVFSPQITQTVLTMMEQVVLEGTGEAAQIAGYRIAGKTGTAQKASSGGGYIDGARITSFVGIFPVEAPRYAVLAVVDEPQGEDAYGSTVAAPIVKSVMETLISIEQIAPSEPVTQEWNTDNRQEIPGNYAIEPENDPWVDESSSNQYSDQYTDEYTDEYSDQYTDEYSDQYTDEYSEDDSEDYLEDSPESFSEDYTEDYSEDASDASDGL